MRDGEEKEGEAGESDQQEDPNAKKQRTQESLTATVAVVTAPAQ